MTLHIELSTKRQSNSHEKMAKSKGPSATVMPFLYTSGSCVLRRTTEAKKQTTEISKNEGIEFGIGWESSFC